MRFMAWIIGALGLFALGLFSGFMVLLFGAGEGDRLAATAAVLGGLIGAVGAALAVYLTIVGQRKDEAEKVEGALRMEVAEHSRLALGLLQVCEGVIAGTCQIPLRDLPTLMQMPEATVYRATADRISRLEYGPLFVVFHSRIAEALQMVNTYVAATTLRPVLAGRTGDAELSRAMEARVVVDRDKARTLLAAWFDVCQVGRTILRRDAIAPQLADAAITEVIKDLDAAETRVAPVAKKAGS
jgi:hypothetical protein